MRFFFIIVSVMIYSTAFGQVDLKREESKNLSLLHNKNSLQKEFDYYKEDSIVCHSIMDTTLNREVFLIAEKMPMYGENSNELLKYISQNLIYPVICDFDIQGTVFVRFIIEADGTVSNTSIARGVHKYLDNEALRIIKNMPKWKPGECNGQKVPVYYLVPIRFNLT